MSPNRASLVLIGIAQIFLAWYTNQPCLYASGAFFIAIALVVR